ncbi:hypothetical protein BO82DRAFT_373700 [Aspergillus uvarum CBS 121591]|uniref:RING-type domain-containing protein n=2 Tax=Aspergillus subgen. Circumdati TaxID=2720871 RepID=A0A319CHN8_9EURO|nr:hypothetical protein BO82DRAFT_373700 [Aspergillus uvarum CBS 121591]PYH82777.1 hypothetical protein BO82DRAFT_373700 [Aspergillus uvarum CBS 121591]PYI32991.1 hypothetical protein BP00DRAFT_134827 [Aspergillus indologenus CBS 114.80]
MGLLSDNSSELQLYSHLAIVLGIGLGLVTFVIMCLFLSLFVNRRERRPATKAKSRKGDSHDKLRKLDAVSPARTLEDWWSRAKLPSEGADGQFMCVVCLESVQRSQEIRELKCLHVFHRECLEKWYLQDHFNCPLCLRAYYVQETYSSNDFVWMV